MKKIHFITAILVFVFTSVNAQEKGDALSKNSWIIESSTGPFTAAGNTGFYLESSDGFIIASLGGDAGYFVADNLAIKAGLGVFAFDFEEFAISYKLGAKYYINKQFPVGLDFVGIDGDDNWLGLQGGYAWFVTDNLSIEPSVRYNLGLSDFAEDTFQGLVGIVFHL